VIIPVIFLLAAVAGICFAQQAGKEDIPLYFFWGQGCPHCEEMKPFIQELQDTYPQLSVKSLETFKNAENNRLFNEMAKAYNKTAEGVPGTFIGDKMFEGYTKGVTDVEIKTEAEKCIKNGCPNPDQMLAGYIEEHPTTTTTTLPEPSPPQADPVVMGVAVLVMAAFAVLIIRNRKQLM